MDRGRRSRRSADLRDVQTSRVFLRVSLSQTDDIAGKQDLRCSEDRQFCCVFNAFGIKKGR